MNSQYLIAGDAENRHVEQLAEDHPVSMEQPEYKLYLSVLEFYSHNYFKPHNHNWEIKVIRTLNP